MDRTRPRVAKLQENFINALVGSLCDAYTFAGLLPGTVIKNEGKHIFY
jgi:cGMP-inhibited 3',5'-cyclic phosphodiesterase A